MVSFFTFFISIYCIIFAQKNRIMVTSTSSLHISENPFCTNSHLFTQALFEKVYQLPASSARPYQTPLKPSSRFPESEHGNASHKRHWLDDSHLHVTMCQLNAHAAPYFGTIVPRYGRLENGGYIRYEF